ncbi:26214_t:CDS:2, partial [Gigaspora margarita]
VSKSFTTTNNASIPWTDLTYTDGPGKEQAAACVGGINDDEIFIIGGNSSDSSSPEKFINKFDINKQQWNNVIFSESAPDFNIHDISCTKINKTIAIFSGFGIVYKARWKHTQVVFKSLYNSDNINVDFLKKIDSHKRFKNYNGVVQIYGITCDPFKKNYSMVTKYVSGGNLYDYLKKLYNKLTWKNKITMLLDIAKR